MMHAGFKLTDCCGRHSIDCNCNEPEEVDELEDFDENDEEGLSKAIERTELYFGADR